MPHHLIGRLHRHERVTGMPRLPSWLFLASFAQKAFKCKGRDANERLLDIHNAMYVLAIVVGDTSY